VRGDAVAGILITLVNVVGGFAIGVLQMDLSLAESLQKFTLLSIGDGLVSQIPALIISIGAGLLVTRASDNNNLGQQITGQIIRYPRAMKLAAGCMAVFGLMPGMPLLPFLGLAGLMAFMARTFKDTEGSDALAAAQAPVPVKAGAKGAAASGKPGEAPAAGTTAAPAVEDVRKLTEVDIFSIEIGYGLLPLAEARSGGDLLARVTGVRKTLAREKGLVVPPVSVRDNLELEANDYRFLLRGKAVARGTILPGRLLAMNVAGSTIRLRGQPTREPVFNLDATWIDESERKTAEMNNYTVVDPSSVLITHLSETLKANSHHLLGRQDVQSLIDHIKISHSALVAELLPDLVTLGVIQRVLQNLLREGVAILNLPIILEGIADFAALSKNPDDLSELVRRRLGLYFVPELESRPGVLRALTLDPRLEQYLGTKVHRSPTDVGLSLDPATGRHLIDELNRRVAQLTSQGAPAVLVVSTETRLPLRRFLEPSFPRLTVLSFQELPSATEIENAGLLPLPAHLLREPVKAAA